MRFLLPFKRPDTTKHEFNHDEVERLKTELNSAIIECNTTFQTLSKLLYCIQKLQQKSIDRKIPLCNNLCIQKVNDTYVLKRSENHE